MSSTRRTGGDFDPGDYTYSPSTSQPDEGLLNSGLAAEVFGLSPRAMRGSYTGSGRLARACCAYNTGWYAGARRRLAELRGVTP